MDAWFAQWNNEVGSPVGQNNPLGEMSSSVLELLRQGEEAIPQGQTQQIHNQSTVSGGDVRETVTQHDDNRRKGRASDAIQVDQNELIEKSEMTKAKRSLAEKRRRNKITQKLKTLNELIPNSNKSADMSSILDAAIERISSLKTQVKSMRQQGTWIAPTMVDAMQPYMIGVDPFINLPFNQATTNEALSTNQVYYNHFRPILPRILSWEQYFNYMGFVQMQHIQQMQHMQHIQQNQVVARPNNDIDYGYMGWTAPNNAPSGPEL